MGTVIDKCMGRSYTHSRQCQSREHRGRRVHYKTILDEGGGVNGQPVLKPPASQMNNNRSHCVWPLLFGFDKEKSQCFIIENVTEIAITPTYFNDKHKQRNTKKL